MWTEEQTWNEREEEEEDRETGFKCSSSSMMRREICLLMSAKNTSSSSSNSIAIALSFPSFLRLGCFVRQVLCVCFFLGLLQVEFEGMLKESNK